MRIHFKRFTTGAELPPMVILVVLHLGIFNILMSNADGIRIDGNAANRTDRPVRAVTGYIVLYLITNGITTINTTIPVNIFIVPNLVFGVVGHIGRDVLSFAKDAGRFIRAGSNMCTGFTGLSTAAVPDQPMCCLVIVPDRLAGVGELESLPFSAASHTFIGRSTGGKMLFPFSIHLTTATPDRCVRITIIAPRDLSVVADLAHNIRRAANRASGWSFTVGSMAVASANHRSATRKHHRMSIISLAPIYR